MMCNVQGSGIEKSFDTCPSFFIRHGEKKLKLGNRLNNFIGMKFDGPEKQLPTFTAGEFNRNSIAIWLQFH